MFQQMKKRMKNEKGLTLIELLAVIVILAIVAAIAIPAIGNIIENSRVKALKSDAANIISAAQIYYTDGNEAEFTIAKAEGQTAAGTGNDYVTLSSTPSGIKVSTDGKISGTLTKGKISITMKDATLADLNIDSAKDNGDFVKKNTNTTTQTPPTGGGGNS